jgi:catalase
VLVARGTSPEPDIKLVLLLQEAFRHCKALGAWGDGAEVLRAAGIPDDDPGVVLGQSVVRAFIEEFGAALGLHRVWDRAPAVMASAVPPTA